MSWPYAPLSSLTLKIGSGSTPKGGDTVYIPEGTALIRSQNIYNNEFSMSGLVYINSETADKMKGVTVKKDDVLINITGDSVARCCMVHEAVLPARVNQHVAILRPNPKRLLPHYLSYYMVSPYMQAKLLSWAGTGGTRKALTKGMLEGFEIPLPPIDIQNKIVKKINAYNDLIENNKRRIALLEESARQLYKVWFVRFRFPGHEHVKIVDGVPEGWETLELQDVCERITDGAHHSPKDFENGLPMASVKDMHSWGINLNTCRKIAPEDFTKLENADCRPKKGDVLIAKDGSYLKHVFVAEDNAEYVLLSSIAILRPNDRIKSNQLAMFLSLPQTKKSLEGYVSGAALPRIILKEFRKFSFLCPPIQLQQAWADSYDCIFEQCRLLIRKNEKLSKARDILLPKLMSGELAV